MKEYIIKVNVSGKLADECLNVLNASELVRCKNCKHGGIDSTSHPNYWCSAHSEYHTGDWFCADGKKRE